MKVTRILVPLDGSEGAEAALPVAREFARTTGATLFVLRVTDVRFDQDPAPAEAALTRLHEAQTYLNALRERLETAGERVVTFLWQGSPAAAIVKAAQHYQIDVIVMTTHGRTGLLKEMFGSVTEAVLRGVTVPVLVVQATGVVVQAPPGEAVPWPGR